MIFGRPGSGKSTFALRLGRCLNLPVEHLDRYFFIENWVERNYEEFLQIQDSLVKKEGWIIDGNSCRSLEMRFQKADMALYFHMGRLLCLWRIFKRIFSKKREILDRAEGCSERVSFRLVRYLWTFDERVKIPIQELRKKYPKVQFFEFRSPKEVEQFFKELKRCS